MKKLCSLFLALLTVLSLLPAAAFAATDEAAEAAEGLYSLGLFQGTGTNADGTPIYSLDRVPTRNQAIIMLIRLLGREEEALAGSYETPFTDITSANMAQYIGYAYENGLSNGVSATAYGGERTVKANQYITFVLRALGYVSGEDFTVSEACRFADSIGLTNGKYTASGKFTRGDVALVSLHALYMEKKSGGRILDTLKSRIEYSDLLAAVNAGRRAEMAREESFDGFTDYLVEDPSAKALLTQAEIDALFNTSRNMAATVSYADAVADVELFFRALRYAYGAYYYFGGDDAFFAARDKVLASLKGKNSISGKALSELIFSQLLFVKDSHFSINNMRTTEDRSVRYEYCYCRGQAFAKDENGYYKMIGGKKWYFVSCSDSTVTLEPTLLSTGELCYSPVRFRPLQGAAADDTLLLQSESGTRTENIHWILSTPYAEQSLHTPNTELLQSGDIAYVAVRCFDLEYDEELTRYSAAGADVKDAKLIIFDLRSNGGGQSQYTNHWVENYSGEESELKGCFSTRHSALAHHEPVAIGKEYYSHVFLPGKVIENDTPFLVLVDDKCGSSGESALTALQTMDNVISIGSNTIGCEVCGNVAGYSLPRSGIPFQMGCSLKFMGHVENLDGKGYAPDVWCDPTDALSAALLMAKRYGLAEAKDLQGLQAQLRESEERHRTITLKTGRDTIQAMDGFGFGRGTGYYDVCVDGVKTGDFTVSCSDPSVCSVRNVNGRLCITVVNGGRDCYITVTCGQSSADFRFYS